MKYSIVRRISSPTSELWIRARFQEFMNNARVSITSGYKKWCLTMIRTRIDTRPAPKKFLNDIQASRNSSPVKWCPAMTITSIHRNALIQKRPDAIQISCTSRFMNGCHILY